jgi:hypothetical protein
MQWVQMKKLSVLVVNFSVHDLQLLQIFHLLGSKFNVLDDALVQPLD